MNYVDPTGHSMEDVATGLQDGGGFLIGSGGSGGGFIPTGWIVSTVGGETFVTATSVASYSTYASERVWSMPIWTRGIEIEETLLHRVAGWFGRGNNIVTVDAYDKATKTATSVKSIDLAAKTYQSASNVTRVITNALQKVADFQGNMKVKFNGDEFEIGEVVARKLMVAIADVNLSVEVATALSNLMTTAQKLGVDLQYIVVK